MIRFSAALVAVAIGVLIGGVAASELLLVYIAIVVSAVALVALAIGVMRNREELFGESEGLAPAGAGASPVPPDRSGTTQDKIPPGALVIPPSPFPGAAGSYAGAFGSSAPAAPSSAALSSAGADVSATRGVAAGQERSADPAPPWETRRETAAREPWTSTAQDWLPAGQRERAASGAGVRAQSGRQDLTRDGTRGGRGGDRGITGAGARPVPAAPRSWAVPPSSAGTASASPVSPETPGVKPGAGSGPAPLSWFDRLGNPAAAKPAGPSAPAPGSGSRWSSGGNVPGGPVVPEDTAAPEGADTPGAPATRSAPVIYGGAASGGPVPGGTPPGGVVSDDVADGSDAEPEDERPAAAGTAGGAGPRDSAQVRPGDSAERTGDAEDAGDDEPPQPTAATVAAPVMAGTSGDDGTGDAGTSGAGPRHTGTPPSADGEPADTVSAEEGEETGPDVDAFADHGDSAGLDQVADPDPEASDPEASDLEASRPRTTAVGQTEATANEAADEPPAGSGAAAAPETALVAVVRGVPRYHLQDCVLIRFMPDDDLRKLTIPQAREEGCTPCGACQPEG